MQKLLSIEWLKLKNYRTFWILAALYIVLLPLFNYEVANGMGNFTANGISIFNKSYAFPEVWDNIGYFGSYFITFLAILVIIVTTNEYTFKTNRQNVIDGWRRLDFLNAKVLLVVVFSIVATIYYFILGSCFGLANSGAVSQLFDSYDKIFYFLLLSLNYLGFALMIAIWIKRSGLAISLFLLYAIMIESIIQKILNWRMDGHYGNFLPLQSSDELLPFPIMKLAAGMMGGGPATPPMYYVAATIAWCAVYYFICRGILLRNDW
jgi:ABC-2 type transport system permease protein